MGNSIIKHFVAEAKISEFAPVKQGTEEGTVTVAKSPFDYVIGVAQSNADAGMGVDVIILGESFVDCEGAVDGTAPLVANKNGKSEQLDLTADTFKDCEANTLVCAYARPIEIDTADAYLRCIVNPYCFAIGAKSAAADQQGGG